MEKVTLEKSPDRGEVGSHVPIQEKNVAGRGHSQCKGPGV